MSGGLRRTAARGSPAGESNRRRSSRRSRRPPRVGCLSRKARARRGRDRRTAPRLAPSRCHRPCRSTPGRAGGRLRDVHQGRPPERPSHQARCHRSDVQHALGHRAQVKLRGQKSTDDRAGACAQYELRISAADACAREAIQQAALPATADRSAAAENKCSRCHTPTASAVRHRRALPSPTPEQVTPLP